MPSCVRIDPEFFGEEGAFLTGELHQRLTVLMLKVVQADVEKEHQDRDVHTACDEVFERPDCVGEAVVERLSCFFRSAKTASESACSKAGSCSCLFTASSTDSWPSGTYAALGREQDAAFGELPPDFVEFDASADDGAAGDGSPRIRFLPLHC
jgi:hypothetical protein